MNEYAVYKGDKLLYVGTAEEIAKKHGINKRTVYYYQTPGYKKGLEKRQGGKDYINIIKLTDVSKEWTASDDQFLVDNYKKPNKEIAKQLNRTLASVKMRKKKLGLTRPRKPTYEVLKGYDVLATGTAKECAEKLGVDVQTIYHYATPAYQKRLVNLDNSVMAFRIED